MDVEKVSLNGGRLGMRAKILVKAARRLSESAVERCRKQPRFFWKSLRYFSCQTVGRQPPALVGPLNHPAYLPHFMQEAPTVTRRPLAARASRPEVLCPGSIQA
jgi:hypothetical protein